MVALGSRVVATQSRFVVSPSEVDRHTPASAANSSEDLDILLGEVHERLEHVNLMISLLKHDNDSSAQCP